MKLCHFASYYGPAIGSQHFSEVRKSGSKSVGRLKHDHGPLLDGQLGKAGRTPSALSGEETFHAPSLSRKSAGCQGCYWRRRTRHHFDRQALLHHSAHHSLSGIRDCGHPCVRHQRNNSAGSDPAHNDVCRAFFSVFVETQKFRPNNGGMS